MAKYLGLVLVVVVGVAAIGLVYTQTKLLEEHIVANAPKMSAGVITHIQKEKEKERVVLEFGTISYTQLTEPILPVYKIEYKKAHTTPTSTASTKVSPVVAISHKATTSSATPKAKPTPNPTPAPTPTPTPTPAPQPVPASNMRWGVFAGDSNGNLTTVETMVGKRADIQAMFLSFNDEFPTSWFGTHLCPDRELLIFWENSGISLDSIIAGNYDVYLKRFSDGAAKYGCPVILSLFHEMNGNWDTWGGLVGTNTSAKIIAAWRRVHGLMPASNIKWAWATNNDSIPNTPENAADKYYPGDAYVDYVGVDGFSFAERWESFGSVFDDAIAGMQKYNKPIYIFSMGAGADPRKAAWITEGLGTHIYTYKNVHGWVWFNYNKGDGNWSINSDAASLEAFKAILP